MSLRTGTEIQTAKKDTVSFFIRTTGRYFHPITVFLYYLIIELSVNIKTISYFCSANGKE